ncbi:MAG: RNA polymerase sigma factor [Cyclobacteriaceae bacterium]
MTKNYPSYFLIEHSVNSEVPRQSSLAQKEDDVIWQAFKTGDESAFVHIYNTYYPVLTNYAFQITKDKDLISDCLQDLFIDIRLRRSKLTNVKSIKLYLLVSFRRRLLKYLEAERKAFSKHMEIARDEFGIQLSCEDILIENQLDQEQKAKLEKAFAQLSNKEREALYYFYYENMSYHEITELFKYTQVKTTRNLVYQALDKLRDLMISLLLGLFLL